jgi:integrase
MPVKPLKAGAFEVSVYLPGNKRSKNRRWRRRYPDKKTATEIERMIAGAIARGDNWHAEIQRFHGRRSDTISDLSLIYLQHVALYNTESRTKICRLKAIKASIGSIPAALLTPMDVARFMAERVSSGCTPKTVNKDLLVLKHMLNWAVSMGILVANPITLVKKLPEPRTIIRRPDPMEIERVLALCSGWHAPIYRFIQQTGVRRREALWLRHDEIDLARRIAILSTTKTKRERMIPLSDKAIDAIASQPRLCEFVFYNPENMRPWVDIRKEWNRARKLAGSKLTIRDLRHAFAIRLSESPEIELHHIAAVLGNSQKITEDFYAHFRPEVSVKRALRVVGR